jgi:hypothetical protein
MKIRKIGSLSAFLLITFLLMACSENQKAAKPFSIKAIFPAGIVENSIEISSEIRTFSKDSLWVYIDGGAEEYLKHNVIEVATADYKAGSAAIVADIYRFNSENDARQMYLDIRPDQPDTIRLGVEGVRTSTTIDFVKGAFLVRLIAFDESPQTGQLLWTLAKGIEFSIP